MEQSQQAVGRVRLFDRANMPWLIKENQQTCLRGRTNDPADIPERVPMSGRRNEQEYGQVGAAI